MSIENRILEEEYIIKLKELSKSRRSNYMNRRYELIVRYMIDDQSSVIFKTLPISDCYFQEIENYNQTPFVVKTDLFTELAELDKTNHGGLIDEIESLKKDFTTKLANEVEVRKNMDEGQKMERDSDMIQKFIEDYGYDPTTMSIMTKDINIDGLNMDLSEVEDSEDDDEETVVDKKELNSETPLEKLKVNVDVPESKEDEVKQVVLHSEPNGDLSFLNQILEISSIDFNQVIFDVKTVLNASTSCTTTTTTNVTVASDSVKKVKKSKKSKKDDEDDEDDADDVDDLCSEEDEEEDTPKKSKKSTKSAKTAKPLPTRKKSAYSAYVQEQWEIVKKSGSTSYIQAVKQCADTWKTLSNDEKQKYEHLANNPPTPVNTSSNTDTSNTNTSNVMGDNSNSASAAPVMNVKDTLTDDEKVKLCKKEIEELVQNARELLNVESCKKKSMSELGKYIQAAQTISDHYRNGDKLHKSEAKANLISLFLIKNYNDPKSMYDIGMALTKGVSIVKNIKQGAKFIKVASEKYKYAPATTIMKKLFKTT